MNLILSSSAFKVSVTLSISDIILFQPEDVDNNEEKEFVENKKVVNLNKQLKKVGINQTNIVNESRIRKARQILDL